MKQEKPVEILKCGYNVKDPGFIELIKAVVLGTYTIFSYDPSDDDCKALYAKITKTSATNNKEDLAPSVMREMRARLIAAEE